MSAPKAASRLYLYVYLALMALLGLTVSVATFEMGAWNAVANLAIAGVKALLVLVFFMHLNRSTKLQRVAAGAGFAWLAILFGLTLIDYLTR